MAVFQGYTITNAGRLLIASVGIGSDILFFTQGELGAGRYSGNPREITELVDKRMDLACIDKIVDISYDSNEQPVYKLIIKLQLTNANLTTSFHANELAIKARLGSGPEILFAYGMVEAGDYDTIPSNTLSPTYIVAYDFVMEFENNDQADIVIGHSEVVTLETGDRRYTKTGLQYIGELGDGRQMLISGGVYKGANETYYKNIGDNREWAAGNTTPDYQLKPVTWERHEQDIQNIMAFLGLLNLTSAIGADYLDDFYLG
ncbi:MAG: hypothetical protein LBQ97_02670 [Fusobacteriaceae bacterium]|jgi:hypothetical protein|nr:hypothetical protein [Fusobacteriaceae bacterium]